MTIRMTILVLLVLTTAILTGGVLVGQELLPKVAPFMSIPFEDAPPCSFASPAYAPFETARFEVAPPFEVLPPAYAQFEVAPPAFGPPPSTQFAAPPTEITSAIPKEDNLPASGAEGFGKGGRGSDGPGMGGPGMGGPGMGGPGYGATWYPSRPVSNSTVGEDFGLVRQDVSAAVPVWRNGGDMLMLSAGVRNSMFSTDAILPDSHQPFPSELWDVHLGTNYMHKFDNGWSGMLGINFGSASDNKARNFTRA